MATPHPNGQLGIHVVQSASLLQRPASFNAASTLALRASQPPAGAGGPLAPSGADAPLAPSGGVVGAVAGGSAGVVSGVGATAAGLSTLGGTSRGAEHAASVTIRLTAAPQRARRSGRSNAASLLAASLLDM
jgi:hypothetical protein